ncbi:hypothetical protein MKW92_052832, partial [Papaver armeniacum]
MTTEEFQSPQHHKYVVHRDIIISPGFRSVAAMAGWDEEALLAASQDTPERESSKSQKRTNLASKSPQTNSRRKRRIQRCSPVNDDVEARVTRHDGPVAGKELQIEFLKEERKQENKGRTEPKSDEMPPANLPCMDKLREELSCAKCLKSAADKCGKKCPKCRQLIGNGRSCIVNTSLWNTIQLLFPQEVEARKAVAAKNSREEVKDCISTSPSSRTNSMMMTNPSDIRVSSSSRNQSGRANFMGMNRVDSVRLSSSARIRRARPSQAEDAALALRLQREEFMVAFRAADEPQPQIP